MGNRHSLVIQRMKEEDFGSYSCFATNNLGKSKAHLTITGDRRIF